MKHSLKIWPQYFYRVVDGSKTFEVRDNDRGFQPGDIVELKEYDPKREIKVNSGMGHFPDEEGPIGYTGASITFRIGYVFPISSSRVVFSLLPYSDPVEKLFE